MRSYDFQVGYSLGLTSIPLQVEGHRGKKLRNSVLTGLEMG